MFSLLGCLLSAKVILGFLLSTRGKAAGRMLCGICSVPETEGNPRAAQHSGGLLTEITSHLVRARARRKAKAHFHLFHLIM